VIFSNLVGRDFIEPWHSKAIEMGLDGVSPFRHLKIFFLNVAGVAAFFRKNVHCTAFLGLWRRSGIQKTKSCRSVQPSRPGDIQVIAARC
jgi:hypothetical protein